MKHHKNLNQNIHNVIDYDDNCSEELKGKDTSSKTSASTSLVASQVEEIMKGVMEKIQCLYEMPKLMDPQRMDRPWPAIVQGFMDIQLFGVTLTKNGASIDLCLSNYFSNWSSIDLDPKLETKGLEVFQKMIKGTQALLEK